MTFSLDTKTSAALTADARSGSATFTQDAKTSAILTADTRNASATFTQDSKASSFSLWSSLGLPWLATFTPWNWDGNGQFLIQDIRNV